MNVIGLTTISSNHDVKTTIDRLAAEVAAKGMTVFARIDHAAGAKQAGLPLRPTELLIFGNAKAGTPLMEADQTMGIDLPLKALAWQDEKQNVWLSFNEPAWLAERHGMDGRFGEATGRMAAGLAAAAKAAAS